jgi:hypothetical protein
MKRKLILMLGTFLLLLLAFGTYQLFVPGVALFDPQTRRIRPPVHFGQGGTGTEVGVVRGVTFYDRTIDGKLRGIYKVSSWTKADDGSYILENPRAEVRQNNGTRAYMSARRARIQAEEIADGINVREGKMQGNVEIFFDQSTDAIDRPHPRHRSYDQRRKQCIQIKVDDIEFSRDMLEIRTDSKVYLWSRTVDLIGRGLTLQWNEDPRELRKLRIDHGEIMIVKELPEQMDMIQLPAEDAPDQPMPPATQPATEPGESSDALAATQAPTRPAGKDADLATTGPAEESAGEDLAAESPQTQPANDSTTRPADVRDAWALDEDDLTKPLPATRPTPRSGKNDSGVTFAETPEPGDEPAAETRPVLAEDRPARNIYQAAFHENVRVHSGLRKLAGADDLALLFEWDRAWRQDEVTDEPDSDKATPKQSARRATSEHPADDSRASAATKSPETQPASEALTDASATRSPADAPATHPATQPAADSTGLAATQPAESEEDLSRRMEIYWDGPLVILPKGTTPSPNRRRYRIAGSGRQVVLTDPEARVVCREFSFQNPQQEAVFRGGEDQPALLQLVRGDEILCQRELRFNRSAGEALLGGAGRMRRYVRSEAITTWADLPVELADPRTVGEQVTWSGRVEATFLNRRVATDDGQEVSRPFVDEATFFGDVEMNQYGEPTEEDQHGPVESFVCCDELHVRMDATETGTVYPTRAKARGNVSARQQGSDIIADLADVSFRRKADRPAATRAADRNPLAGLAGARVEPTLIHAEGGIDITYRDPKEPDNPPMRIEADGLDADLLQQVALVTGKPAKLWQGENRIVGEKINFDENAEAVKVTGPGQLEFMTDQDLSGNRLAEPRPVRITWSQWMLYHGQYGQGIFDGDVDLRAGGNFEVQEAADTGGEWLTCGQMRLFMETAKQAAIRKEAPVREKSRSLGMGVDRFSSRQMLQIEAEGGKGEEKLVKMQSRSPHPENPAWLERRVELRGVKVIYDARTGNTKIDGRGSFLAEDYRQPRRRRTSSPGQIGGQLDRPSQTLFTWSKSLFLSQADRRVNLRGKASMVHRSGKKLLKVAGLKVQPFGELKAGRISKLRCDTMDVWFHDPNADRRSPGVDTLSSRNEPDSEPDAPTDDDQPRDIFQAGPQIGSLRMFYAAGSVSFQDEPKTMNRIIDAQRILSDQVKRVMTIWGYAKNATPRTNAAMVLEDTATGRVQRYESPTIIIRNYGLPNEQIQLEKLQGGGGM